MQTRFRPGPALVTGALAVVAGCLVPQSVLALGRETFGNKPVFAQQDWPQGLLDSINLKSRVYAYWVNGNESFFFRGKTEQLNEALSRYARVRQDPLEIVFRPERGLTRTFDGTPVACDWELKAPGGTYLHHVAGEKGTKVYFKKPTLIVFAGGRNIEIPEIRIPSNVRVVGPDDLLERYLDGLKSTNNEVRATAGRELGAFSAHPKAETIVAGLRRLLADKDWRAQHGAVRGVIAFGPKARKALPNVEKLLDAEKQYVRDAAAEAVQALSRKPTEAERRRDAGYATSYGALRKILKTAKVRAEDGPKNPTGTNSTAGSRP